MNLVVCFLWTLGAGGVFAAIRYFFGVDGLKHWMPYLIAGPVAYFLLRWFHVLWPIVRRQTTARGRTVTAVWMMLGALWLVVWGCGQVQPWISSDLWNVLSMLVIGSAGVAITLLCNRIMAGTWFPKQPQSK
jgi:hypothetical protein